jgi:hypothetical protein
MHTTASTDGAYNNLMVADLTAQVTDNDTAAVVLSKTSASATEGGAGDSYLVHLGSQPENDVVVTITPDAQVSRSPTSITFSSFNWNMDVSVTVGAVNDTRDEVSPHTGTITHSVAANASTDAAYVGIAVSNVSVSITDNDAPPNVTLGATGSPAAEGGGVATVTATLSAVSGLDVTVSLAFSGTAANPADYTRSGTSIVIPAGSSSGSVSISAVSDTVDEVNETVIVDMTCDATCTEATPQQATVTITDDDAGPSVTLSRTPATMAESGGTSTVTATLSAASAQTVMITLAYTGTATAPADYTASGTLIAIAPGATTGSVTLTSVSDTTDEVDETIIVDMTCDATCTEATPQQATVTIADDDVAPPPPSGGGGGGGSFGFMSLLLLVPALARRRRQLAA